MAATAEKGGADFSVRALTDQDGPAFVGFVARVPEGERRFLKEDLEHPQSVFSNYFNSARTRPLIAVDQNDHVVGLAGAFPEDGWSSHVAELRVFVSTDHRRLGIGRLLAKAALLEAVKLGCTHAFVEVIAEQDALVGMFQDLGFEPQALLPDFVRDGTGEFHDLMLLTVATDEHASLSHMLGLDEVAS